VAQLRTGHSPLLAGYLHRIGRRDSATCPYCNGADETAEHLVLHCSAHDQARRDIWPGGQFNTDPRRFWDFLERIGAVTRPPPDREWERESADKACYVRRWIRWVFQTAGCRGRCSESWCWSRRGWQTAPSHRRCWTIWCCPAVRAGSSKHALITTSWVSTIRYDTIRYDRWFAVALENWQANSQFNLAQLKKTLKMF